MRTKSKWLALLLVVTLAACGGGTVDTTEDGADDATTTTAAATTTTAGSVDTTEAGGGEMTILADVGVDLEAGTIKVGLLSDLSGGFAPLVSAIVTGHEVFWENVNRNGGIHGLQVELEVADTGYEVDRHVQLYEELKDEVVAFGHSTGSPHTLAINDQLQEDGILAIPLTWYSGWSDPAINSNLVPHGAPYCLEAMNTISFMYDAAVAEGIENPTIAIASVPGDFGLDSATGAALAAEALGIEVVYDGSGAMIDEASFAEVAAGIADSGADIVFATATPGAWSAVYGQALARQFVAKWSGAFPFWNPAFIAPDSPIKDAVSRDVYIGSYVNSWGADTPGNQAIRDLFAELRPDVQPFDYLIEGFVEGLIMKTALDIAYENGDLTQSGVLAAAKSIEGLDFNGIALPETYSGAPNDIVQRAQYLYRPDPEGLASGQNTGLALVEEGFVSDITASYEFTGACYVLGQ